MIAHQLVGRSFGNLTVLRRIPPAEAVATYRRVGKSAHWLCVCRCGGEVVRTSVALILRDSTHCGCMRRRQIEGEHDYRAPDGSPGIDLTGQRFGILTAVAPVGISSQGWSWSLHCDCGRDHIARTKDLRNGNTGSCGCLKGKPGRPINEPAIEMSRPWRRPAEETSALRNNVWKRP